MLSNARPGPIDGLDAALLVRLLAMARGRNLPLRAAVEAATGLDGRPRLSRIVRRLSATGEEDLPGELCIALKGGRDRAAASSLEALRRSGLPVAGLLDLSRWLSARDSQRSRFLLAIGYPLSIAVTACFLTAFLFSATVGLYALGDLQSVFGAFQDVSSRKPGFIEHLAFSTGRLALWLSEHPSALFGWAVFILLVSAVVFLFGARIQDRSLALGIPGLRRYVRMAGARAFCGTLRNLLQAGVPAPEALEVAVAAVPNASLRRDLARLPQGTAEGEGLGELLRTATALPPFVRWRLWSAYFRSDLVDELSRTSRALDLELSVSERWVTSAAGALSWCLAILALVPIGFLVTGILKVYGNLFDLVTKIG